MLPDFEHVQQIYAVARSDLTAASVFQPVQLRADSRKALTWTATMAIPVSRTSVFEKKDTRTPVTKPIVS